MLKRLFIPFFLVMASGYSFSQSPAMAEAGSTLQQFRKNNPPTDELQLLLTIAHEYYKKGDTLQGRAAFLQAFDYCRKTDNLKGELNTCIELLPWLRNDAALFFELQKEQDGVMAYYRIPAERATTQLVFSAFVKVLTDSSIAHYYVNKIDLAEKECLWAIDLGISHSPISIRPYDILSYWYMVKGNLNKALFYSLEAARILEKDGDSTLNERPYDIIGKIYFQLGKVELSLEYYTKAISLLKKRGRIIYGSLFKNVTQALIRLNRPKEALSFLQTNVGPDSLYDAVNKIQIVGSFGDCYFALGNYVKAEQCYLNMMNRAQKVNNVEVLVADFPLGRLYVTTKKYEKGISYLSPLVEDSNKTLVPVSVQLDVQALLFQADSVMDNYISAIQHLQQVRILNDSLFNNSKSNEIEELKVQYETEKKDQGMRLQNADLRQTRVLINVFVGGAIMLVLLLLLLYNRYRRKQKNNRLLRIQQEKIKRSNGKLQQLNDRQQKLLAEKEWLLKEIHHRIKNNLQIVISLLNAQSDFLDSPPALQAIRESRDRMQAIALIHQKLYQPDNATLIDMSAYIHEMVAYLEGSYSDTSVPKKIDFGFRIEDIHLDMSQAVPLGLILNEAITNAAKYAFSPDREDGKVVILLQRVNEEDILLKITDNGVGFPENFDPSGNNSLGIQLIKLFAEQLEGILHFQGRDGVEISLLFKEPHTPHTIPSFLWGK